MEIMPTPLHVTSFQWFHTDAGAKAYQYYLPEREINSSLDLLGAVCGALGTDLDDLWLQVWDLVTGNDCEIQIAVENWLMNYGLSKKQYLQFIVNRIKLIDRLFLWLAIHMAGRHLNVIHTSRIWTSHRSDIMVLTDASVVLILNCVLYTKQMTQEAIKKHDNEYTATLCDPCPFIMNYVSIPKILNNPVKDTNSYMEEIRLQQRSPDMPIQQYLALLLECSVQDFCNQLGYWIWQFESDLPMILSWLAIHGLSVEEYIALLEQQRDSDGLEVWAVSIALGQPINVIFEDAVWSTVVEGFDHLYPSAMWLQYYVKKNLKRKRTFPVLELQHRPMVKWTPGEKNTHWHPYQNIHITLIQTEQILTRKTWCSLRCMPDNLFHMLAKQFWGVALCVMCLWFQVWPWLGICTRFIPMTSLITAKTVHHHTTTSKSWVCIDWMSIEWLLSRVHAVITHTFLKLRCGSM